MRLPATFVVVVLAVLHFLMHVGFGMGRAAPDLLTVALLIAARETRLGWAAGTGFLFGILEDALSVLAFGANTVTMSVVGVVGATTRALFVGDSLLFVVSYFFLGKWLRDILHWILMGEELRRPFADQVLVQGLTGAAYAALAGIVVLAVTGLSSES
jgi:rod shape-determining protein MreD